jgi:DNA-binding response OmpR family regulator
MVRIDCSEKAIDLFANTSPHILIVEAPKEGVSGLALCQELRSYYQGLFILISSQESIEFHILALDLGVDLTLKKCDGPQFLTANILALQKRYVSLHKVKQLTFGSLTVDSNRRDVFIAGQPAALSTIEFQLIWSLAKRHGSVVTRDEIHHELYKRAYNGYDRTIDLYISRIRQKIGDDPGASQYLKTVRGIGYQFVPNEDKGQPELSY